MREEKTDKLIMRKLIAFLLLLSSFSLLANSEFPKELFSDRYLNEATSVNLHLLSNSAYSKKNRTQFFESPVKWATNQAFNHYIDQHKDIAIREMQRTGVPASIKLAQALLESNAGRSTLAVKANNHFGIKCGSKWKGKTYYRKDDDYKKGRLVKSCFRKYKKSKESFVAHSNFLKDNMRYGGLFHLNRKDYEKWAKGLKKAGYATSKTYDKKLIKLIKEYRLHQYDAAPPSIETAQPRVLTQKEYIYVNDAKMVFAKAGDTPISIAKRLNTSPDRILSYNEQINNRTQTLAKDTRVFIQKKRKRFRGKKKYHRIQAGETMYGISQLYGLRMNELYSNNKMPNGSEPAVGQQIKIRGKAKKMPRLRTNHSTAPSKISTSTNSTSASNTNANSTSTSTSHTNTKHQEQEVVIEQKETTEKVQTTETTTSTYHTVQAGETLWRISQKYGLQVEELMNKNNLQSTLIRKGTILKIK